MSHYAQERVNNSLTLPPLVENVYTVSYTTMFLVRHHRAAVCLSVCLSYNFNRTIETEGLLKVTSGRAGC